MKYFSKCKTAEDVKATFKDLAKRLHPDCGGDAEEFKKMMNDYREAFNRWKNTHETAAGETYEKETTETPEEFAEIINKIIYFAGCKIEIIGSWIWISGNTATYHEELKAAGFWYSKNKKAWYFTGETGRNKKRRGRYTMDQLRYKWGTEEVRTENPKSLKEPEKTK